MRALLHAVLASIFVVVQFLDLAVLDAPALAAPDEHATLTAAAGPGAPGDPLSSTTDRCIVHCGCHALHNMDFEREAASCLMSASGAPRIPSLDERVPSRGDSPPTPPPLI